MVPHSALAPAQGKVSTRYMRYLDIWIFGYCDMWIFGYLHAWIYDSLFLEFGNSSFEIGNWSFEIAMARVSKSRPGSPTISFLLFKMFHIWVGRFHIRIHRAQVGWWTSFHHTSIPAYQLHTRLAGGRVSHRVYFHDFSKRLKS